MQDEIRPEQWEAFFKVFSERNQARATRLETLGELGAQEVEQGLPFIGIVYEDKELGAPSLQIMLSGDTAQDMRHLVHTITDVRRVFAKQGPDGSDEALEIETHKGEKMLLQFVALAELTAAP